MEYATSLFYCFSLLSMFFGLQILKMDRRDVLRIVFFALCIIIALSSFVSSRIYAAADKETIALWERINFLVVAVCWAVNLNFYILLTEHSMGLRDYAFLYLPTIALVVADCSFGHIVSDYVKSGTRWKYVFSPMYYAYIAYSLAYCVADMALVIRWAKNSKIRKHRLQARMIIGSTIPLWVICIIFDYVLTSIKTLFILPIGPFGRLIYICILWYSFIRYRFMVHPSSILLKDIAFKMEEIVFLIDRNARILVHNGRIPGLEDGGGRESFLDLVEETAAFADRAAELVQRKIDFSHLMLSYRIDGKKVATSTYLSSILDDFDDLVGILVISREDKNVKSFRERYRISERQMEIINLILAGLSNTEISAKLGIAKKTTETHIFNIYSKLGIDNKIELYNFAAGFHLTPAAAVQERAQEGAGP
jgi:DNA-binding CsgD family transcriptional regulator